MRYFDAGQTSANSVTVAEPVELKYPLWWSNGTHMLVSGVLTSGSSFVQDGGTGRNGTASDTTLHILSSKWPAGTNFALEVTAYSNAAGYTNYVALWDMTANAIVSSSQISTNQTTASVFRSTSFMLTDGHSYGITLWTSSSGGQSYLIDASLIIYPA